METSLGSGRSVTVALLVVNSFFVTSLVVASLPLTVVANEANVGSRDVCKDSLLVVPLGDVPAVDCITRFSDVIVTGVGPDVFAAEIVDGNTVLVEIPTWLSSLLPTLVRRQRTATGSSFMVPVGCRSGSSLQCQTGTTPFQPGRS